MSKIEEALLKTIEKYNHYRSPEVTAKVVEVGDDGFVVDFDGIFCRSCGVYDYFEDLIYELKGISGFQAEIEGFESTESETIRVKYIIK